MDFIEIKPNVNIIKKWRIRHQMKQNSKESLPNKKKNIYAFLISIDRIHREL